MCVLNQTTHFFGSVDHTVKTACPTDDDDHDCNVMLINIANRRVELMQTPSLRLQLGTGYVPLFAPFN